MADPPARLTAALADRYRLERELGAGGMATVYLALDLKHHRNVAIKVLRPELAAALGTERFLREVTLTAQLDHPHILPLLDSGQAGDFLYYVMPLVEGESLRDRLTREKQLPLDQALQITREVADALDHAHARGVIHRDIKPENILLSGGHARVADFGIARALTAAGGETLTQTGLSIGTPAYMSPEQAGGGRDVDGRTDVYALGCVLYEMLAGHPPFSGGTALEILARQATDAVPSLLAARPTVTPGIEHAITKAMAKVPTDRFHTAVVVGKVEAFGRGAKGVTYDAIISYVNADGDTVVSTPVSVTPDSAYGGMQKATINATDIGLDLEELDITKAMSVKLKRSSALDYTRLGADSDGLEDVFLVFHYRLRA